MHSPHPLRRQSLRVAAFGEKVFSKLMTTIEAARKVKEKSWDILSSAMKIKVWRESIGKLKVGENKHQFKVTF